MVFHSKSRHRCYENIQWVSPINFICISHTKEFLHFTQIFNASNFVSVELKINSFSPLLVQQGPYTILKDL